MPARPPDEMAAARLPARVAAMLLEPGETVFPPARL